MELLRFCISFYAGIGKHIFFYEFFPFHLNFQIYWLKFSHNIILLMLLNCDAGEESQESLGLQEDQTSQA